VGAAAAASTPVPCRLAQRPSIRHGTSPARPQAALPAGLAARLAAPGSPGPAALALAAAAAAALAALLERARFARWSRGARGAPLPGPPGGAAPFLGAVVRMVRDPAGFWEAQRRLAPCGVSWNSLLGRYILLITDAEQARAVCA
jgi:cytochrome P450 family 710 subfamily A protein